MNTFHTTHRIHHRAEDMYGLVAAVEDYPQFVPLAQIFTCAHTSITAPMTC